ncbi:MAG: hypothetical protein OXJ37_14120 [Bryobacterales bacterium]|nr:hypothetical protein [Bryobacterales bacterium]MDE0624222.1 hypothetical protein [Bryobacterales bacterium]
MLLRSVRMPRAGLCFGPALLAAAIGLQQEVAFARDAVSWIENYDEAIEVASKTGKPIFLEFRCAP